MENAIIKVDCLEKSFKKARVLDGISFDIEHGAITAILGPNASGKTTLLKCILGLMIADKGTICINGTSIQNNAAYRKYIGFMPQAASFPDNVSAKALLGLIARFHGQKTASTELIDLFGIGSILTKPVRELSEGTKQKISAVCALSFGAQILILDEPTVGLDPISSIHLKEQILAEKQNGKTVLLTSHVMTEVEELADNIIFLLDGKLRFDGQVDKLKHITNEVRLERAIAKLMSKRDAKIHA